MNPRRMGVNRSTLEAIKAYHERTKHHYVRYAASLGYLDWETQPDPFRRYEGAPLVSMPIPEEGQELPFWRLYVPGGIVPVPLTLVSLSLFFRYALSLTAWKQAGESSWFLRANPSSGNLHPTEGYAVLPALDMIRDHPGIYHYAPKEHALELRAKADQPAWELLAAVFPPESFLVGLTSIHWREAWKYGERAFRYCQHDVGHALGSLRYAAAALGWRVHLLTGVGDETVERVLGLKRLGDFSKPEQEQPELLALVAPGTWRSPKGPWFPVLVLDELPVEPWAGKANKLSPYHETDWPVIGEAAKACESKGMLFDEDFSDFPTKEELFLSPVLSGFLTAEKVILGRRSAVSMDGITSIPAKVFYRMLARLIPTRDGVFVPWDTLPWRPRIHLGIFIHRVVGLVPGLYALNRDPGKLNSLQSAMDSKFTWKKPDLCPPGLGLYLLQEGDVRRLAAGVSCGQDIAGDGAFSLGMIAEFRESLAYYGAAFYRNLFWEAGLIGQVLYLEAEEAGVRATGIGCFFDDPVHEVFGLDLSGSWRSLYHFTVGGPVEDSRLVTKSPYGVQTK